MTENILKEAQEIVHKIEHIRKLRSYVWHNPMILESKNSSNYVYLSWADNEDSELKNTITAWCDGEIKRLQTRFDEL